MNPIKKISHVHLGVLVVIMIAASAFLVYNLKADAGSLPAVRQCYGNNPAPDPSTFSCITSRSEAGYFSTNNALCIAGSLWSTICKEEELGLNPNDGLDLAEERNIKRGDGQRIPGKPKAFYVARGENISIKCAAGNTASARRWVIAGLSEFRAFQGLTKNYSTRSNPPLHPSLRDEWMGMSDMVIEILNKKLSDPTVLCQ
ncbi:MAG: hypothetical protein A3B29_04115 [Candidatus Sungbacteria bacterium RIFCSPLOWO2_01_FULL_51_34]|uniref:Uncharacterized protein n=1 Tax=Candidatus Sungbacteria bacterium RIFCSPHIGHO2_02_FULL_51_29 TaxID=1802273 RepID=A0A1G2KWS9_9BACT|nr:MAG: hypothetical protein A3C16_03775 [Candidatus Sungbacteria bacterium RIFCSPHIGHO2_02_FULL_51_29]OHA06316.1 MAG: hypothetical protein A3B29_04115 [Candidatus Sungbacteria bacterium RIFCSPLOWO2_01_FULL_51_34]